MNTVLKNALRFTGKLSVLASEEENTPVYVDDKADRVYAAKRTTEVVVEDGNKVISLSMLSQYGALISRLNDTIGPRLDLIKSTDLALIV